MSISLCPAFGVGWQAFTTGGLPLNAGLLNTYIAGGTTPQATYTTSAGNVANNNPIVLGADGRPPSEIWLTDGVSYRFDLTDSLSNLIKSYDNISGAGSATGTTGTGQTVLANTPTLITPVIGAATGISLTLSGGITATGGTLTTPTLTTPAIAGATLTGAISGGTFSGTRITNSANTTQVLTDQATITWDTSLGAIATVTLGANRTMAAPTNLKVGGYYVFLVTQDGTGGRTLTWNAVFKGNAGSPMPQPGPTAASVSTFEFQSDGTNLYLIAPVYVEGTWTPSIGGNATYTAQTGTYTKIGRLVFIQGSITVNAIGTGSTTSFSGLPFAAIIGLNPFAITQTANLATSVVSLLGVVTNGTTVTFGSRTVATATESTANAIFQNSASISFSGCYQTT